MLLNQNNSADNAVKRIALLVDQDDDHPIACQEFAAVCAKRNIQVRTYSSNDAILDFNPDFVISMTAEHAKLTPYPTYGLINWPKDQYLELPRYLRNILTYDGYLTTSPKLRQMLEDVMFGTRKLDTAILPFDFYPELIPFQEASGNKDIIIFEPNLTRTRYLYALQQLLQKFPRAKILTCTPHTYFTNRTIYAHDVKQIKNVMHNAGIAICLQSGDTSEQLLFPEVLQIIAASCAAIVHYLPELHQWFGDNLFYIPEDTKLPVISQFIGVQVNKILHDPQATAEKVKHAHQQLVRHFDADHYLDQLLTFHRQTLHAKGYLPHPDPVHESQLPSVSYIIRTGGKNRTFLERALTCLVDQKYPDLRAILVIHARFDYIDEIIKKYSSLKIKVVESIKSKRSQAIRDGMAAVETDLFGLFDDDDELFPNHVRSLVRSLQYHSHRDWRGEIGMVYSGSIHADDSYPVLERIEYRDHKLTNRFEKRAIEHFKFYSSTLMSRHSWFMPNGWLARRKLLDNELLQDPQLDTCEDLYFELQIAQKTQFAFSMEVTAVHHFHHLGNSTIDDSYKHIPDTQRIALRNLGRVYASDTHYDTYFNLVGRRSTYNHNQIGYQDVYTPFSKIEYYDEHPFFPLRPEIKRKNYNNSAEIKYAKLKLLKVSTLPIKFVKYFIRFMMFPRDKKLFYYSKFKMKVQEFGLVQALFLTLFKLQDKTILKENSVQKLEERIQHKTVKESYYQFRLALKTQGLKKSLRTVFKNKTTNS